MSTKSALLAAIITNPEEDTPRLEFADLLDEEGNPRRAALIRLGVEVAVRERQCGCVTHAGRRGERSLGYSKKCVLEGFEVNGLPWRKEEERLIYGDEYPKFCGWIPNNAAAEIERGFVVAVHDMAAADWLAVHENLFWHPSQGRECPETAHPIRWLFLKDRPAVRYTDPSRPFLVGDAISFSSYEVYDACPEDVVLGICSLRWPGLVVSVPRDPAASYSYRKIPPGKYVTAQDLAKERLQDTFEPLAGYHIGDDDEVP